VPQWALGERRVSLWWDGEKPFRGLKKADSPTLKGIQIYHNFVRPHEGLNGATPSERAGIKIEGENKWLTIIQNATKRESGAKLEPTVPSHSWLYNKPKLA
jgi:hypothetical protein